MAKNQFLIRRAAFGNTTYVSTATNATNSVYFDAINLPKGAIIVAVKVFPAGAITNGSNFEDATVNLSCGAQAILSNDQKASVLFVAATPVTPVLASTAGVYVSVGGPLVVYWASSTSKKTGIAFDSDIYVEYLYCGERDIA